MPQAKYTSHINTQNISIDFNHVLFLYPIGYIRSISLVRCGFLCHTLLVLLVSLPPHRAPPRRFCRFFTRDPWRLARHVAELLATVLLLGGRWFYGRLH